MAITNSNIYQDLIMNPEFMPNRLQSLEMFPPVDVPGRIDFSSGDDLVPGMGTPAIDFTDAPVDNIFLRQNNPTKGLLDRTFNYRALNLGTPEATAKFLAEKNFQIPPNLQGIDTRNFLDKTKSNISSGIGKGINLGKAALSGIASLITGIPGIGLLANAFRPMSPEEKAMRDFYGDQFGLTDTGQIASGIMQGYNPVSLTGFGLSGAIDKRIARIQKTLRKKKSETLQNRLKALQDLKAREAVASAAALEKQRRGRRPGTGGDGPPGTSGIKDTAASQGFSPGQAGAGTGGYSYDAGGREGFGYGLKEGGLIGLL
jgi:hypothetical protein